MTPPCRAGGAPPPARHGPVGLWSSRGERCSKARRWTPRSRQTNQAAAVTIARHSRTHRWHASAQRRQASSSCFAHSAAQASQISAHSSHTLTAHAEPRSTRVWQSLDIAAQSKQSCPHAAISALPMQQPYAHASHACSHSLQASRHARLRSAISTLAITDLPVHSVSPVRCRRHPTVEDCPRGKVNPVLPERQGLL